MTLDSRQEGVDTEQCAGRARHMDLDLDLQQEQEQE
jgi:hypothetical protein